MSQTLGHDAPHVMDADEAFVRQHRTEILKLAADFGIRDVKYASGNRLVGRAEKIGIMLPTFSFMAAAEERLGRKLRLYSQSLADSQSEQSDLRRAQPL